jgi:hypothetical protein
MDADWISPFWQAFSQPRTVKVCGLRLPAISVWHQFALDNLGNGYVCGGVIDEGDVQQLLYVVSQTRKQYLSRSNNTKKRKRYLLKIQKVMMRNAYNTKSNVILECKTYAEQSLRVPGRWRKRNAKNCSVPSSLHMVAAAAKMGIPVNVAWDMPYSEARCWFDALAEQEGDESIQNSVSQWMDEKMTAEKMKEVA